MFPTLGADRPRRRRLRHARCSCSRTPSASADFYKSHGFPEVKVRAEVARDPAAFDVARRARRRDRRRAGGSNDLYVRFFVDEGRRELVDHVRDRVRRRARARPRTRSSAALQLGAGQPFTAADASRTIVQRILEPLQGSRAARTSTSKLTSELEWNDAHDRVVLRYSHRRRAGGALRRDPHPRQLQDARLA